MNHFNSNFLNIKNCLINALGNTNVNRIIGTIDEIISDFMHKMVIFEFNQVNSCLILSKKKEIIYAKAFPIGDDAKVRTDSGKFFSQIEIIIGAEFASNCKSTCRYIYNLPQIFLYIDVAMAHKNRIKTILVVV
jgi:hypothetical protein